MSDYRHALSAACLSRSTVAGRLEGCPATADLYHAVGGCGFVDAARVPGWRVSGARLPRRLESTLERRSGRWRMSKAMPEDTVREKAEELRALYGLG